jgi:IMP dehydrogenase
MGGVMFTEAYSYDDVLLLPGYSDILPKDCDIKTVLCADVGLNIPVISSAMDTVTEEKLAIAIALEGGSGVIHRNLNPEDQAAQVANVKRYLNWVIDSPVTVGEDARVRDVKAMMDRFRVSGMPVLNTDGRLVGIITNRDLRFCTDDSLSVVDVMTKDPVVVRGEPSVSAARKEFDKHKIEKLPVVDNQGRLTGLITVKDMENTTATPGPPPIKPAGSLWGRRFLPRITLCGCRFLKTPKSITWFWIPLTGIQRT